MNITERQEALRAIATLIDKSGIQLLVSPPGRGEVDAANLLRTVADDLEEDDEVGGTVVGMKQPICVKARLGESTLLISADGVDVAIDQIVFVKVLP